MSADNYIAVKKIKDKYAVWMEFASNDKPNPLNKGAKYFSSYIEAMDYALNWCSREVIVEYGVVDLDDERQTAFLKTEKEASKKAVEAAVSETSKEIETIFNMHLHELFLIRRNIYVLRVCKGWLYKWGDSSPVFVPDTMEDNYSEGVDE
jgi:hypothetical protein